MQYEQCHPSTMAKPQILDKVTQIALSVIGTFFGFIVALVFLFLSSGALADPTSQSRPELEDLFREHQTKSFDEPSQWAISFDNDILVPASRDQDYTYGLSVTTEWNRKKSGFLFRPLHWLNEQLGLPNDQGIRSLELGAYGFTPEDKTQEVLNRNDRPFASIIYLSTTLDHDTANPNIYWRSSLSMGVLGLDFVGDLQNEVHRLTDSETAMGWEHQISDGGEPTLRYALSRQRRWQTRSPGLEFKTSLAASFGYITELSYGLNVRLGKLQSSWRSSSPELSLYGEHTSRNTKYNPSHEHYWIGGAAIKLRAHNVFLQGQFKSSDLNYQSGDLNHAIIEAWAGYSFALGRRYRISYLLRGHSSEIKSGDANRNVLWGGLTFSKQV